jgi:hypothetical protein
MISMLTMTMAGCGSAPDADAPNPPTAASPAELVTRTYGAMTAVTRATDTGSVTLVTDDKGIVLVKFEYRVDSKDALVSFGANAVPLSVGLSQLEGYSLEGNMTLVSANVAAARLAALASSGDPTERLFGLCCYWGYAFECGWEWEPEYEPTVCCVWGGYDSAFVKRC